MKKFFKEFKEFINRGNVIDLAVALVISTAFSAIVNALVDKVIMPLIAAIFGKVDVSDLSFTLNNSVIPIGAFFQAIINFLIIAFCLFLVIKAINRSKDLAEKEKAKKITKEEKQEVEKLGTVDMKNKKAVYEAVLELRKEKAQKAKDEELKKAQEAETVENLLKQIRDLLKKDSEKTSKD